MNRAVVLAIGIALSTMFMTARGQFPFSYYGGGTSASTVSQANSMGMADLVQAAGQASLNTSAAAINLEQARSMNLDNQMKSTTTYFEMRKANTAYRKAEDARFPGLSTEDSWRVAQMNTPKRLRSTELDPVTGKIYWPMQFENPTFQSYRQQIDQLFVQRETVHGSIGYENYTAIQQATNALMAELNKNIGKYSPGDFLRMKSFIESLAFESTLPAV